MASDINIATALRIDRDELADSLGQSETTPALAIVDVRDDDYVGGHIKGSLNVPSSQLDWKLPELVRLLKDKDRVVFHCALSQQRGPKAAMLYLRERERLLGQRPATSSSDDMQKVYVLEGGFVRWQERYGKNPSLTEAYAPDIWRE